MKIKNLLLTALVAFASTIMVSCSYVEPNNEGVLMTNYGRNGESDFSLVKGRIWTAAPGTELYNVPMNEQRGDCPSMDVTSKDGGVFTVDPTYAYKPKRGSGIPIIFNYKSYNPNDANSFFEMVEGNILNPRVLNAYKETARNFSTDSLMYNVNAFEKAVQNRLQSEFDTAYFSLIELSSGLTPPKSMRDAIEARNVAIQKANMVKNQLLESEMLLKKAKIDQETNKVKSQGLTKEILTEQYIEMLRNSKNRVIITDGKTPIILN
jgi:hypothetical protein